MKTYWKASSLHT